MATSPNKVVDVVQCKETKGEKLRCKTGSLHDCMVTPMNDISDLLTTLPHSRSCNQNRPQQHYLYRFWKFSDLWTRGKADRDS